MDGSVHTVKGNKQAWLVGSKETGPEVNSDKTKNMVMSRDQNAGRSHNIKIDNKSFERVEEFKYLGEKINKSKFYSEEIKSRVKSGNVAIIRCRIFCLPVCYPKV